MTNVIDLPGRRPVLFIAIGRQRVGKTTVLNTMIQYLRRHGAHFKVWNGDRHNQTYNLSVFHSDVVEPPSTDFQEVRVWLEERIAEMAVGGYDVFLDIGGGETPLSRLIEELPIVQLLEQQGVRVVVAHVVGPERADLDYLAHFAGHQLLAPEATLIILNAGLVMSGRSANSAFTAIREHPVVQEAVLEGAKLAMLPLLSCMALVTDRGLSFADAAAGVATMGQAPLSFFDQARVGIWWERELPTFFAAIPPLWLPALDREATPSGEGPSVHLEAGRPPRDRAFRSKGQAASVTSNSASEEA